MDGLILLDKPAGMSSARAVAIVKRLLPRGTRLGHAGTLDPFATGLLILMAGRATKRCEELMGRPKTYEATIQFGSTTPTDDPESPETPWPDARPVDRSAIEAILPRFVGEILQKPPVYSALKMAGRRACDRARDGETFEPKPRLIQVYKMELLDYRWPSLEMRIDCGRGTYIRSIARDLGEALCVGGHLRQLRRTRIGDFQVVNAAAIESLTAETIPNHLRPVPFPGTPGEG